MKKVQNATLMANENHLILICITVKKKIRLSFREYVQMCDSDP